MSQYISSVVVTLSPKEEYSSKPLISMVINIGVVSGSILAHAARFVNESPLIKPYLSRYNIISLTFKYSEL
jgi:hypothetical protein